MRGYVMSFGSIGDPPSTGIGFQPDTYIVRDGKRISVQFDLSTCEWITADGDVVSYRVVKTGNCWGQRG